MMSARKLSILFAAVAAAAAGAAQGGPIDLGVAGIFNIYTLGDFAGTNSSVQGAAAAAGSFSASNYSVNPGLRAKSGLRQPLLKLAKRQDRR